VILINEDNEYETGDYDDPFGSDVEGVDAYAEASPIIVVSPRTLSVQPNVDSQRCNRFKPRHCLVPINLAR
jgi:hypothetical protein